ncbi:hypothetical protein BS78_08G148300, partial [Paspalum vaginatum]
LLSVLWTGAISDGPATDKQDIPPGPLTNEPKVPNKFSGSATANVVLLPEALPSDLCKHSVVRVDLQDCGKVCEVWGDGGFTAAHPGAWGTIRRAVDALAVGVAACHI